MLKVGITGNIGSGKTIISSLFRLLGVPVFEADTVAKNLMDTDPEIRQSLIHLLGSDIYGPGGTIDRKKMAGIIFNDPILLDKVNGVIHPEVKKSFKEWVKIQQAPYVIHEAAILFESGFNKLMDYNILITAPELLRLKRVMERNKLTEGQVRERIKRQWTEEKKTGLADFVIINDDQHMVIPQVLMVDKKLRENGKIR